MLYIILGSSGSGKTTLGESVFGKSKELVSTTTRPKRKNETHGIDYYFVNKMVFALMKNTGGLAEWSEYDGNQYGVSYDEIHKKTKTGNSYVVTDYSGYKALRKRIKNVRGVFVETSKESAKNRLKRRGEKDSFIKKRMELFDKELLLKDKLDYVIDNNETLENSVEQFQEILEKEAARRRHP